MSSKLSTGKIIGLIVLGVLVVMALWFVSTYNTLINLEENAKTAQADIEVQYQRRFDLIPNLVKTAQGIADLEKTVFQNLADARTRYAGAPSGSAERIGAINQAESALSRLLVIVENYPQLKSSESFLKLQDQLEGTENRISVARTTYNEVVNTYNKRLRVFPSNVIASFFAFGERARYEAVTGAEEAPAVEFDFNN
ncbi:LemA family protein [Candidatus Peregrinibacteria bacterium CG_4_9_14_0_2_um_filter_53_11]|nr:MAG: LemA family protein [Candidatus Peregrinibacteria bacterium CG_4_9_14_0_2_um_filter_53_11]